MSKKIMFVLLAVFTVVISLGTVAGFLIISQSNNPQTANELISGSSSNVRLNPALNRAVDCGPLDSNNDGIINIADFTAMANFFGRTCTRQAAPTSGCGLKDGNMDGKIDQVDVDILVKKYGKTCNSSDFADCGQMDIDNNNVLTIRDFTSLANKFHKLCRVSDGSPKCGSVDSNLDGVVNQIDFESLRSRFGKTNCELTTPPSAGVVCGALDADGSGSISASDYDALVQFVGSKCLDAFGSSGFGGKDMNGDGVIDRKDLDLFLERY